MYAGPKTFPPVRRIDTITRGNVAAFLKEWAEEHDTPPKPIDVAAYFVGGGGTHDKANAVEPRHLRRTTKLLKS